MSEVDTPMPVRQIALRPVKAPAKQAVVLICRRCERRADGDGDAGRRLARKLRKLAKERHGKGAIRTVFTACMSLCPRNALTIAVVPGGKAAGQASRMYIADAARPKAAALALLETLQGG